MTRDELNLIINAVSTGQNTTTEGMQAVDAYVAAERERLAQAIERHYGEDAEHLVISKNRLALMQKVAHFCADLIRKGGESS